MHRFPRFAAFPVIRLTVPSAPYLIADDLTGALEAGAAFRSRGWPVTVHLPGDGVEHPFTAEAGLQIYSTETRNAAPREAQARLQAILPALRARGGPPLFKKIDSTLRGPVGAEIRTVLEEFPKHCVVLCPANPLTGRSVRGGVLFVGGDPVHRTAFARDPGSPVVAASIAELLGAQGLTSREIGHGLEAGPSRVWICDASTMADVRSLVERARREPGRLLLVGSSAVGAVLAESFEPPEVRCSGSDDPTRLPSMSEVLLLCGSRHPASARQLQVLSGTAGWRVVDVAVDEPTDAVARRLAEARSASPAVAVRLRLPEPAGTEVVPEWIRRALPQIDAARPLDGLFVTGGETAAATADALGVHRLNIVAELEPGIVVSRMPRPFRRPLVAVTKPGAYGAPEVWLMIADRLLKYRISRGD